MVLGLCRWSDKSSSLQNWILRLFSHCPVSVSSLHRRYYFPLLGQFPIFRNRLPLSAKIQSFVDISHEKSRAKYFDTSWIGLFKRGTMYQRLALLWCDLCRNKGSLLHNKLLLDSDLWIEPGALYDNEQVRLCWFKYTSLMKLIILNILISITFKLKNLLISERASAFQYPFFRTIRRKVMLFLKGKRTSVTTQNAVGATRSSLRG